MFKEFAELPDYRTRPQYDVKELIVSGLIMFLFKQKSRNKADAAGKKLDFQDNIKNFFGVRVADMDTVDKYLRFLAPDKLEIVKQNMFREIVKSKTFQKHKFNGQYFMIAVDGTGLQSFDYEPYPGCPFKEYKNGKKVWTAYVLEAKIISSSGFSLSLATEWIENPTNKSFQKQDIESKAFKRLAQKLKNNFPRLPLMFLLDGLYPNNPVFNICKENNWKFIITLKDKSLKSVQEQITDKELFQEYETTSWIDADTNNWLTNDYKIFKEIIYKKHKLFVLETKFEKKNIISAEKNNIRFVHITNIKIEKNNAHKLSQAGRLRWKIENEGFNNQKNNEYNLTHKFSRTDFNATKNYYQLLQIADIINQFTYKLKLMQDYLKKYGLTEISLIGDILAYLKSLLFDDKELIMSILSKNTQLRY